MPEVKFYYAPGACSLSPHILLHEAGIPFSAHPMKSDKGRIVFPEEYRQINPKMKVPAISIDGVTITEGPAILTAISSLAPEKNLLGRTLLETAKVHEWLSWAASELHMAGFGHAFRPPRCSDDPASFDGIKAKGLECIQNCFAYIEENLNGIYAVGDDFTAADSYLFVFYRWGNVGELGMRERYPKFTALVENLVERGAIRETLEVEGFGSTL